MVKCVLGYVVVLVYTLTHMHANMAKVFATCKTLNIHDIIHEYIFVF